MCPALHFLHFIIYFQRILLSEGRIDVIIFIVGSLWYINKDLDPHPFIFTSRYQSWALSVFFNFFNNEK